VLDVWRRSAPLPLPSLRSGCSSPLLPAAGGAGAAAGLAASLAGSAALRLLALALASLVGAWLRYASPCSPAPLPCQVSG